MDQTTDIGCVRVSNTALSAHFAVYQCQRRSCRCCSGQVSRDNQLHLSPTLSIPFYSTSPWLANITVNPVKPPPLIYSTPPIPSIDICTNCNLRLFSPCVVDLCNWRHLALPCHQQQPQPLQPPLLPQHPDPYPGFRNCIRCFFRIRSPAILRFNSKVIAFVRFVQDQSCCFFVLTWCVRPSIHFTVRDQTWLAGCRLARFAF